MQLRTDLKREFFADIDSSLAGIDYFFSLDRAIFEKVRNPVCKVKQVHGRDLLVVSSIHGPKLSGSQFVQYPYDGMITSERNLVLTVYSADCLPLLFFEPKKKIIAAVHAGWRGSFLDICGAAVRKIVEVFEGDPAEIRVVCGPSIRACCFEIGDDVSELFYQKYPHWKDLIADDNGKKKLNLHELNHRQLMNQGVLEPHLSLGSLCTYCHPGRLPSYRREGSLAKRLVSGIVLK